MADWCILYIPTPRGQGTPDFIRRQCQCRLGTIKSAGEADDDDDDGDAALSYDQRSVRAGPPVGPARPVRSGNIVVTVLYINDFYG